MIRVALARTRPSYEGLEPPYGPGRAYPEHQRLVDDAAIAGPPNPAYAAIRTSLRALGLDASRFGTTEWNPLGDLVAPGNCVVLKPNLIRHFNPLEGSTVESIITHGAVLRALADYAFLAVGSEGCVTIAEAPQQDCNFNRIREIVGLDDLVRHYRETLGRDLAVIDLRREEVVFRDGIIVERRDLTGDPAGYRIVDLGDRSSFHASGLDSRRFRGADYDPVITAAHHSGGRHEYLLSETVLSADLVVNLPKLKTHKKTGVTLALKNLVGINGDKNWLPHHSIGSRAAGGDEFPSDRLVDRLRSRATEFARPLLTRGSGTRCFRAARRLENAVRGEGFIRSGNWWGNRTTWRMCLDLNRCLYYSDAQGLHLDATKPVRTVLTVLDGIVAGEGDGPLAARNVALGVILASTDPVALDLAAIRLMGFDERRIPKVAEAIGASCLRITEVRKPADVEVIEPVPESGALQPRSLDELATMHRFLPQRGWEGHIEREDSDIGVTGR